MSKFLGMLPAILMVLGAVYGSFDSRVFAYINAHGQLSIILGGMYAISEAIANTEWVKSNSLAQLVVNLANSAFSKVLHK